ncbi:MAG: hypothetical protein V3R84_02605 [Acidimicrobiia bacterium]
MDYRELEEMLCRLPSVDAVRIVGGSEGITEVHALSPPDKTPKQVVRDIQSLAMARYGTNIDRRVISVVQIASEAVAPGEGERPRILNIDETPEGERVTVAVTLGWRGEEYRGETSGPMVASARFRLVGEAVLRAMEEVFGGTAPLALDAIGIQSIGPRDVMVAVVVTAEGKKEEVHVGTSLAKGEDANAAVRAVLDALNRRIPQLLR